MNANIILLKKSRNMLGYVYNNLLLICITGNLLNDFLMEYKYKVSIQLLKTLPNLIIKNLKCYLYRFSLARLFKGSKTPLFVLN